MPVDPGNLLLLGHARRAGRCWGCRAAPARPRSTASTGCSSGWSPGCRSARATSCAWARGGLLTEIPSRPLPRAEAGARRRPRPERESPPGRGSPRCCSPPASRAGWAGATSCWPRSTARRWWRAWRSGCWRRVRGRSSRCSATRPTQVDAALGKLPVERVRNPDFAEGLSTSLKRGLAALPPRYRRGAGLPRRHAADRRPRTSTG